MWPSFPPPSISLNLGANGASLSCPLHYTHSCSSYLRQEGGPCLSVSYPPAAAACLVENPSPPPDQLPQPTGLGCSLPPLPLSAPRLPRMPLALLHVVSSQCYEALAGVLRCLGHQALAADRAAAGRSKDGCRRIKTATDICAGGKRDDLLSAVFHSPQCATSAVSLPLLVFMFSRCPR